MSDSPEHWRARAFISGFRENPQLLSSDQIDFRSFEVPRKGGAAGIIAMTFGKKGRLENSSPGM